MSEDPKTIKYAETRFPVLDLMRKRFSARSFSDKHISDQDMQTIFEAAGWAASAGNEQPWQYVYAHHGSEGFAKLYDCLDEGNKIWNKNSAVLVASIKRKTFGKTQKENEWAAHDTGLANSQLFLQAVSMDIYPHPMAGFYKDKLKDTLELTDDQEPICMIALGYLGDADKLDEPFKTRELTPRNRQAVGDFVKAL